MPSDWALLIGGDAGASPQTFEKHADTGDMSQYVLLHLWLKSLFRT